MSDTEIIDPEDEGYELIDLPDVPETYVGPLTSEAKVLDDELARINRSLKVVNDMIKRTKYPDEACRLILTEERLMAHRRKCLAYPFGFGERRSRSDDFYDS